MTTLKIYTEQGESTSDAISDPKTIANKLHTVGVHFERWRAEAQFDLTSDTDAIIRAYQSEVNQLMDEYQFMGVDVVSLTPDHPDKIALRRKFLDEHTHSDFEVRFFVQGKGLFYIHVTPQVYGVLCQQGDLISLPANIKHWFDMGETPCFKCIRLFSNPEGWVAQYTNDPIAQHFPRLESF